MAASVFDLPEVTALPGWLHPELAEDLSLVALIGVAFVAALAFRFVRRLVVRGLVVSLLLILAIGLWSQRHELSDCIDHCSCSLFGQVVQIPADKNPRCDEV